MPYHLKATESVPSGIKRIVREEIDSAIGLLKGAASVTKDEAIHETRKSVKKIRGALRLVSAELGDTYRLENRELRSASCRLSELRNATAIIEVFDDLREKYGDELGRQTGTRIRQALVKRKHRVDREAHDKEVDLCIPLIEKHQKLLRDSALSQGERIYDQKPKQFAARMKHLWIAWQTEPKSLSKLQKKSA